MNKLQFFKFKLHLRDYLEKTNNGNRYKLHDASFIECYLRNTHHYSYLLLRSRYDELQTMCFFNNTHKYCKLEI